MEFAEEFEIGRTYLLETQNQEYPFEVFQSLTKDRPGLCITSELTDNIKEEYDLDGVEFSHLSDSGDRTAIGPMELDLLGLTIKRFASEKEGTVLLDGIDYLLSKNDTSTVIGFIRSLQDRIHRESGILLIVLNTSDIEEKNVQLLKNRLDLEIKSMKDIKGKEEKSPITREGDHLVSQVRDMMEFLKEQEQHIEKEVDQMDLEEPTEVSRSKDFKTLKDEIETLREENESLKTELERIKAESEEKKKEDVFEEEIVDDVVATVKEEKEDIEEGMEKVEDEEEMKAKEGYRSDAMMETLRKLEDEVGSLRDEIDKVKEESSREDVQDIREERKDKKVENEEKETDEEIEKEPDITESEGTPDIQSESDYEVIQEPKLEVEYQSEKTKKTAEKPKEESEKEPTDQKIIIEEDKTILKSDFEIAEDVESENSIEVQKGVILKGSLKAEGDITVEESTTIQGEIISRSGDVKIGKDCKVNDEIFGRSVSVSERSKVEDIVAKKEVILKNNTRVRDISCQEDVK
ncbi:MAG: DUF835 domain-containing protein, partial [Candidatus Thermoplasmatota archaeon]|nr:DUF835 domain-containing protein [Candidatus Thermoplasmatota archaeon]